MSYDNQNIAIDMVADTGSPVVNDIRISFRSALKIYPLEIIKKKNFFPQLQLTYLLQID